MGGGRACRLSITGLQYPPRAQGLHIKENNTQDSHGYTEPVVTVQEVCAEYFYRSGSHYLFYEEQPEGCPAVLKTRIKRKGGMVEICRQGAMGSNMVFEAGGRYRTEYPTPFGTLLLDIVTETVEVEEDDSARALPDDISGEDGSGWPDVKICYLLENQGEIMGEYELSIRKLLADEAADKTEK